MSKKLVPGLALVLAVAACAVAPMAAQAAPHYYQNGKGVWEEDKNKLIQTFPIAPRPVIEWGKLMLKGTRGAITGGEVICYTADVGTIVNPRPFEGPAGEGATEGFTSFRCEQKLFCPTTTTAVKLTAERLPWHKLLTEEVVGIIRQETTGIKLAVECFEGGILLAHLPFVIPPSEKGQRPKVVNGTEALHPSLFAYDESSGELEIEGSAGGAGAKTEGAVRIQGYLGPAVELITITNP